MFCNYFNLGKYLNRIAICVAILLLSLPVFAWDPDALLSQEASPSTPQPEQKFEPAVPQANKTPDVSSVERKERSNTPAAKPWDPDELLKKEIEEEDKENPKYGGTLIFIFVAIGSISVTLLILLPRLMAKCPRCGKILHSGHCNSCFWPQLRCELCQSSPLYDGVCPNCGAYPADFPDIRYNDSADSQGRKAGGFGIVYSAIIKDGGRYSEGYMLKRSKTYKEMNDFIMKDVEFKARRDGIPFEADVLSYLQEKSFRGAPKIIARGDELNSAMGLGPWYLMEKARGARMDAWMRTQNGCFSSKNQGRLLIELARSLVGLHELGVCHRDFKPENVFWDEIKQIVTIIDYGSASMPKELTVNPMEQEVAAVSQFWAPPEQFHSRLSSNDETADIFSYGVIFCAVVLGREHLNRSNSIESYKDRVSNVVGSSISDLLFSRLLAIDRNNRRNSLSEFVELLSREWGY